MSVIADAVPLQAASPSSEATEGTRLLLIAQPPGSRPVIILASGSYETDTERVFFDGDVSREVLRLPLDAPYATRSARRVSVPAGAELSTGDLDAPAEREALGGSDLDHLLQEELTRALLVGDVKTCELTASLLAARVGTQSMYQTVNRCLNLLATARDERAGASTLPTRIASETALSLCERLRSRCPVPTLPGLMVLTSPPGDRHVLALRALAHQFQEGGRRVQVLEDLPLADLLEAVRRRDTTTLVLSIHVPMRAATLRRLLRPVREAAPAVFIVVGGPGAPAGAKTVADLVSDDPVEVAAALAAHGSSLTAREREVLGAVAEGLTTQEVAQRLGLSSSTVKTHMDHVLSKTGTSHRSAAVAHALREGWLS